jgi:hypothetical protein
VTSNRFEVWSRYVIKEVLEVLRNARNYDTQSNANIREVVKDDRKYKRSQLWRLREEYGDAADYVRGM